ncbi:MAG: histidine phosphatase family protein [Bacteroidales bacterium]|nr:histidine phosphatase family protein [Bacteroidales bacterium]
MNTLRIPALILAALVALIATAAGPMATDYTFGQCEGSLTPYPSKIETPAYPDSLTPVFINHVGRHGARYPASSANCLALQRALAKADSAGTITPLGRSLAALNNKVMTLSEGRWGALDSLGMAEQAGIATRMFYNYAEAFGKGKTVQALSSYSPRAMMSMFSFVHQLDRLNNRLSFTTSTGSVNSPLLRPFDTDEDYIAFRREKTWQPAYDAYLAEACPLTAIKRVLGDAYPADDLHELRDLALVEYYVLAGLQAMGLPSEMQKYFTLDEANALWSCFNLRQYLQRTATTVSAVPAEIAADLVLNIIDTTDAFITGQNTSTSAVLRFGHAETLMPLLSLLRIPGCRYMTNYFDTVARHWRDFYVVPMASNIQFIVFQSNKTGRYYVRVDLNEMPVALRSGDSEVYYPWGELRRYLMDCVPLYAQ